MLKIISHNFDSPIYEYHKLFRNWNKTFVHNKVTDFVACEVLEIIQIKVERPKFATISQISNDS